LQPVDTGRVRPTGGIVPDPNAQVPDINLPGGINLPGLPAVKPQTAPITRPSFLQAFLANLGPALAGGLAYTGDPKFPYAGIGGAMQNILKQQQIQHENQVQQSQLDLQNAAAGRAATELASKVALQDAETARLKQITPLDVQQKQLEVSLMQGQIAFYANPENIDQATSAATAPLGKLSSEEQAQLNAAKKDAQVTRKFDPINQAVQKIGQDRFQISKADETSGYKDYLNDPTIDRGVKDKNRATFLAWKAKQNPIAVIAGNMLPPGTALDQQAELYAQTHEMPPALTRSPGTVAAIIKRAAELHPEQNLAMNQAEYKANQAALTNVQKTFDMVTSFENTAIKNLDQVIKAGQKIPDLGARFANIPVRSIDSKVLGTPEMARFRAALLTAKNEAARVLTTANASGVLSDEARREASDVLDGNLPFPAMVAAIGQLKTDFANRHSSYQQQIADIKSRISGKTPVKSGNRVIDLTSP
jgi:hypothetical protein